MATKPSRFALTARQYRVRGPLAAPVAALHQASASRALALASRPQSVVLRPSMGLRLYIGASRKPLIPNVMAYTMTHNQHSVQSMLHRGRNDPPGGFPADGGGRKGNPTQAPPIRPQPGSDGKVLCAGCGVRYFPALARKHVNCAPIVVDQIPAVNKKRGAYPDSDARRAYMRQYMAKRRKGGV
jgi:hypothetical protein